MANAQKYTMAAVGHMLDHYGRQAGEDVRRGNEAIDHTRTHQNYNLGPERKTGGYKYLKQRLFEVKHLDLERRKDINVMIDWVITLPDDVPPEKAREFFESVYEFNSERYGTENVISAWVHMDESTPHMHFAFVPVVIDDDGSERLCAKEVINRGELQRYHPMLQKFVEERMGQSVAILNGATAGGNLTILEMKARSALERLAELDQKSILDERSTPITAEIQHIISAVKSEVERLLDDLKTVKGAFVGGKTKAKAEIVAQNLGKTEEMLQRSQTLVDNLKSACDNLPKTAKNEVKQYFRDFNRLTNKTRRELTRQREQLAARSAAIDDEIDARVQAQIDEIEGDIVAAAIAERNQIRLETAEMNDKLQEMDAELHAKQQQLRQIDTQLYFAQHPFLQTAIINQKTQQEIIDQWTKGENHARTND